MRYQHLWLLLLLLLRDVGGGGRVFCDVGIVLTWGATLAQVSTSLQPSYAGFQLIVYPSSVSIVGVL